MRLLRRLDRWRRAGGRALRRTFSHPSGRESRAGVAWPPAEAGKPPAGRYPTDGWHGWSLLLLFYAAGAAATVGAIWGLSAAGRRDVAQGTAATATTAVATVRRALASAVPAARVFLSAQEELPQEALRVSLPGYAHFGNPAPAVATQPPVNVLVELLLGVDPAETSSLLQAMVPGFGTTPAADLVTAELAPRPAEDESPAGPPSGESDAAGAQERVTPTGKSVAETSPMERKPARQLRAHPWGTAPLIAIYQTHSSEAYHGPMGHGKNKGYSPKDFDWGGTAGVIAVGDELARVLTDDYRIPVIHSRNIHDYPVYRNAYTNSHVTAKNMLAHYPSIRILLDVHRDGLSALNVSSITTVMGGERLARISLIVGRGQPGLPNPHWEANQTLARLVERKMEELYPGLSRGITVRRWTYNQELSEGGLLVEIGDHNNTKEEALKSAALFADVIAEVLAERRAGDA